MSQQNQHNNVDGPGLPKTGTPVRSSSIFSLERFVMNKQYSKRMFAQLIFCSLLVNSMASVVAIANTDVDFNQDDNAQEQTRCGKSNNCCKPKNNCCKPKHKDETFDFVIVGGGHAGCVLANRLSENGKYTICVLDAGRDDARVPEILPEPSAADVPQPGDYHWGQYVRGGTSFFNSVINRGFGSFCFFEKNENRPNGTTTTAYPRYAGLGGCSCNNGTGTVRNAPYNWDQWKALGLTDWDASTPTSTLIEYYKKFENRSQMITIPFPGPGTVPLYNPLTPGAFGGFDPAWYGFDGQVPLTYGFPDAFAIALAGIVATTLSAFGYPAGLVDLDYPPTAHLGGLSATNSTQSLQIFDATVTLPGTQSGPYFSQNKPFAVYNFPLYGDDGFRPPVEFQDLNNPAYQPADLRLVQRVTSASAYLYPAESRPNLTIKTEVLVTNLIVKDKKAQGVEYYEGYNIYQTGRNPNTTQAGYGGTVGDAKYNALLAKNEGKRRVFAKKAVVLSAGVFNTPQILMLSGIGNKFDLESLGIKSVHHLPGVGQHLIDNQELIIFFQMPPTTPTPTVNLVFSAFIKPTDKALGIPPAFDFLLTENTGIATNTETGDLLVQKSWAGLRNIPAFGNTNTRNTYHNILLDATNPNANPGPITVASAVPPIDTGIGSWAVTFTIPSSTLSAGGFTVSGNTNPNYNGKFTSTLIANNVPGQTTVTLLYPSNPGIFGGGVTTLTGDPAFIPTMVKPGGAVTFLVEQVENNRSEGYVKLQSADPTVPPLVVFNYLSNPQDLQNFKDVMMNTTFPIMEALQSSAPVYFQNLLYPAPSDILYDGIDPLLPFSTTYVDPVKLETFLLNGVGGHHAMGTCKMGLAGDPMAVVDQKGAVHGIKNLYVADMSVAPVSVRWPNGTVYVIAEKIAADIIAAYP